MMPHEKVSQARAWWAGLQPDGDRSDPGSRAGDRAALARLRRCATVAEAMQDVAAMALFRRVGGSGPGELPPIGLAAAVLAHVREDLGPAGLKVARHVGPESLETPETALLKPLRFRRLIEADSLDERLAAFRRLAAIARGKLPVLDLAAALLNWSDRTRIRWVYDYWNAGAPPAPEPAKAPQA